MKVLNLIENEDGSANLDIELTSEEIQMLVQDSLIRIIKAAIKSEETKDE